MTYQDILNQLEKNNHKVEFIEIFEKNVSISLLEKIKNTDKINCTASLIRHLITMLEYESEIYLKWQKILFYYLEPENKLLT